MKTAQQWFDEYGESHQNPTNKLIHWICVPTIFFSIIALLAAIPHTYLTEMLPAFSPYLHWGSIAILIALFFYLRMSFMIFLGMLGVTALSIWGAEMLSHWEVLPLWASAVILFVAAWIGQFYGHHIEGKKPSFIKDLQFLLVGPAWLLHFIYKKLGIKF